MTAQEANGFPHVQRAREQVAVIHDIVVRIRRFVSENKLRATWKRPPIKLISAPDFVCEHLGVIEHLTKCEVRNETEQETK